MSFLKKLGQVIANVAGIVTGFGPIFTAAVPKATGLVTTVSKDLAEISNVVVGVEAAANAIYGPDAKSGPQKLIMAAPQVAQIIMSSSILVGHKIANASLFQQGAGKVADGMADILNSLHEEGVSVVQPQDVKPS